MKTNYDYIPVWNPAPEPPKNGTRPQKTQKDHTALLIALIAVCICVSVLLTYTLTASSLRNAWKQTVEEQNQQIKTLEAMLTGTDGSNSISANYEIIAKLLREYSYYADSMDAEKMGEQMLKAYVEATGDLYAEYYTEEEYRELENDNVGSYSGIGVSVVQTSIEYQSNTVKLYQIISVYENSGAYEAGVPVGDYLYAVKIDGEFKTVHELGYTASLAAVRGEEGTAVTLIFLHPTADGYDSYEKTIQRKKFTSRSVTYSTAKADPETAVIRISSFDLTTPNQLKEAMAQAASAGARQYIFDVRNNPGGDLQSIKACLSYFLNEGDLILSSVDKDGNIAHSYVAEPMTRLDEYASCNVAKSEIGMYRELKIAVLCNENTASAAEVFTATLRDYGLAVIVGEKTFGKGIMQSILNLAYFGNYSGYLKMTTYAYVTHCGISYHGIGIEPEITVGLSEEAKTYSLLLLPEEKDNQLSAAIDALSQMQ